MKKSFHLQGLDATRNLRASNQTMSTVCWRHSSKVRLPSPPTDCLSPIEDLLIKKGLSKAIDSRFVSSDREPRVTNGNPFQVEVGLIFGGDLPGSTHSSSSIRESGASDVSARWMFVDQSTRVCRLETIWADHPGGRGIPRDRQPY